MASQDKIMDDLIAGLIRTTTSLLPFASKATTTSKMGDLRQNAHSLIKLSHFKLDRVIEGLLHMYSELVKSYETAKQTDVSISDEDQEDAFNDRYIRSKIIVFQLFVKTLSAAIKYDKLDLRFDNDFLTEELYKDENEEEDEETLEQLLKRQEEEKKQAEKFGSESDSLSDDSDKSDSVQLSKEEQEKLESKIEKFDETKLPKLDANMAQSLHKYCMDTLFPATEQKERLQQNVKVLKHLAARTLFKLSVLSFDIVFSKVEEFFKTMKADEVNLPVYNMIEFINFDKTKLSRLIILLNETSTKFKKNAITALANPLRRAIWNYILNFPHQFIADCREMNSIPGNPNKLFQVICERKAKKQASIWPVQTMLLLLCPKILSEVIMLIKMGKSDSTYKKERKHFESLIKTLKVKNDKMDYAVVSFVDLYKASTYLSKSDLSALRFLISQVQNVVLERLIMNSDQTGPVRTSDGKVDVALMVDFLVSAYRINPRHVVSYIFPFCFRGSGLYKLVMAKAMLKLAQESAALPWHPTLSASYSHIVKPVRLLFQDLLNEERNYNQQRANVQKESTSVRRARARTVIEVEPNYSTETLLNMLALFYTEPKLVLENTGEGHVNDIMYLLVGLTNCLGDINNIQVQNQAYRLLQKFFDAKYIIQWCPTDVATGFTEISSGVMIQLSVTLMSDKDIQGNNIKTILDLVKEITSGANKFITQHKDKINEEHLKSRKRVQSWESIESALLVLLCSTESDIWLTAASCFGDLCDQIDILGHKEYKTNTVLANYNLYRKISSLEDLGKGRTLQQKGIKKLLRRVEVQTKANMAAFIEVYARWKHYTQNILNGEAKARENKEDTNMSMTKMKTMWKNYATFLCSLSGVCLQTGEGVLQGKSGKQKNTMTEDLIKDLMQLLTSDHKYIRDNATKIIGNDLSPAVYGILFQNLHHTVATFFGEEGAVKVSQNATQFVDMAIDIVKSVLEQAEENSSDLALANFETLILSFVKYCSQLVFNPESVRIKCRLCILIDTMMNKKEYITFGNELQFKFQSLRAIAEWTSDFASNYQDEGKKSSDVESLYTDLDVLCMRAIAALLKNLELQKLKRDKGTAKEKLELNRKEFLKYFQFLSKYLSKAKADNNSESSKKLREYTIAGLGNLLESNINYGLEHFMRMAYDEDQETRSAFLAVLTKIMKQGIQLESEHISEPKEKYEKLLTLLFDSKLSMVFLMLKSVTMTEQDELCKAFVKLFAEHGNIIRLLKTAIDIEVEQTTQASTLFRANSSASKMLTAFSLLYGKDYMTQLLSELVNEIIASPAGYEIDPTKIPKDENVDNNLQNLMNMSQRILDSIFNSIEACPVPMRVICDYLGRSVEAKFPSDVVTPSENTDAPRSSDADEEEVESGHKKKYVAIGGLLFLRFLNPAIVAPRTYNLVENQPNAQAGRCLLLVSKLVQNIANGVKFGRKQAYKEAYMKPLDPFIEKNLQLSREFFDKISDIPADIVYEETIPIDEETRIENLLTIHRFLFSNMDKLTQKAQEPLEREEVEKLATIVLELGKPPEKEKTTSSFAPSHGEFTNVLFKGFMGQMTTKNPNLTYLEEKKFFYKSGMSKEQRPVLYFIARNCEGIDNDDDHENAMYLVLKTMQSVFTKPYEFVFDVTMFKEEHGLQLSHFTKFYKFLPDGAKKNLARLIIYNPNSYIKDTFSRSIQTKIISRKNAKKIVFATSLKELSAYIDDKNYALPEDSYSFEKEEQTTISPAWVVHSHHNLKEAVIKLSNTKLCVVSKKDTIFGLTAKLVDYVDISRISNVKIESHQNDSSLEQVVVEYDISSKMALKTEMNKQLLMNIKASVTRQQNEKNLASVTSDTTDQNTMRQEDIPGSVLNMCFLNLESKFPKTRNEAYNLLAALAEQFDFPMILLEADNMCVPHNTGDLVVTLSEQVAKAKPFLTAQFLTESLRGFNKVSLPYKFLCLKYMKPWISNLTQEYDKANNNEDTQIVQKIKEWFPELVNSTMRFEDVYPAVLSEVWGEISRDPALVDISMDCIIQAISSAVVGTKQSEILNDLVVTLASRNCQELVVNKIMDFVLNVISNEIVDADEPLEENAPWIKVITCCRFLLMLSFQNRINVVENVPSIFFIISLMIGRGSLFFRSTIHALTLNIVHSLATALKFNREQRKLMQSHLVQLSSEKFRLMFIGSATESTDPFAPINTKQKNKLDAFQMWDMETLTHFFMEVMKTCSFVSPDTQRKWQQELLLLFKSQFLVYNPIILPRLLTAYGVMIRPGQEATDTLPFVMDCLIDSFVNYSSHKNDLPMASLLCLGQYCYKLSPEDPIFQKLFLIPVLLSAVADPALYPVLVHVLDCIVTAISSSKSFKECSSMEDYFNRYCRDEKTDPIVSKFEKITGISFKTHFSFAFSSLFIKGLTLSQTKERTAQICSTLINVNTKISPRISDILGFITALIPYNFENIPSLLGENFTLFTEDTFAHPYSSLLFVRYLLTVVQNVELDSDKTAIYSILCEAFKKIPEVFEPIYPDIMPRVIQVYNQASSPRIAEVSLALVNQMMIESGESFNADETKDRLKDIHFTGVNRAGSFKTVNDQTRSECHSLMLEFVKNSFANSGGLRKKEVQVKEHAPPKRSQSVFIASKPVPNVN